VDFTAEVERSLRVLDGAVVIFDGKMGVEPQSETVWRQADKYKVPRLCFINKINALGGDFKMSLESIKERLSPRSFAIQLPMGVEDKHQGVIDIILKKAWVYGNDEHTEIKEAEIPEEYKEEVEKLRLEMLEKIVEVDEQLMAKYLEDQQLTNEEIISLIRRGTISGEFFPVLVGDGRTAIVKLLLNAVVNYLPSPIDVPDVQGFIPDNPDSTEVRKTDDNESFSALAFKIASDPYVGKLCFIRVYSGILKAGSYVYNSSAGAKERIGRILRMHANHREDIEEIYAGDIAAVVGLKSTKTGHTLCDETKKIILESITFPDPVISVAIEPKTKQDQERMGLALNKLSEEDPTFKIKTDEETLQTIISGMGELHLEIIVERMKREFKVEANVGRPQVAYKETVKSQAQAEGKYIRQSGGRGQYGHCWLRIEPKERGTGYEFIDKIKGGIIPKEYIPAIQKGVKEAMENGVLAGYPLVDFSVAVYDGSFHDVDSSEAAFKIAGSLALQEAVKRANPVLLEPIMKIEVVTPENYMGDVIGDLNSKRAQINEMKDRGNVKVIDGFIPLAEMFNYSTTLRSLTQGRGSYTMEFDHYKEVPQNILEKITKKDK
jgi:elongation factor G